ncbi:MAG: Hpt domain-containing protein [Proteobacteria bacterium]|nr:Hpt domain-containing protein [Cystobacterineae bacterium]MCL2259534.1 Hpt domain-containing protein [Cystobacterineae bacterium]MCL2313991.1 Hpt domain-containing protein [Pseudomonadota bacterium]
MPDKLLIIGEKTASCSLLEKLLGEYAIETFFVRKMQELPTTLLQQTPEALLFLETSQAQKWMDSDHPLTPALLLPEAFPPPIPFKKLAETNVRLLPRETDALAVAKQLFCDIELHRFQKSIADLNAENQQPLLTIFAEFRHTLYDVRLQLHALLSQLRECPHSKEILSKLRVIIHRLAGSSGSYGFMALSKTAKTIEDAIDKQDFLQTQNLSHAFLEMLSCFLPPPLPHSSPLWLIYDAGQQARNPYLHWLQTLGIHAVWAADWVECWKIIQNHPLSGALLNMDKLPVESWPPLWEILNNSTTFATLPTFLLQQNPNDAQRACATRLRCLGLRPPPSTLEEAIEIFQ